MKKTTVRSHIRKGKYVKRHPRKIKTKMFKRNFGNHPGKKRIERIIDEDYSKILDLNKDILSNPGIGRPFKVKAYKSLSEIEEKYQGHNPLILNEVNRQKEKYKIWNQGGE